LSDDKLVVLNNQNPLAPQGGVGLGTQLFRVKPSHFELVPKSTRQDGAIPGTIRNMASGQRMGVEDANGNIVKDEVKLVLLAVPQEQREYYLNDGKTYSKDMKECFSLDNVQPHARAKNPPAMFCASCPMGDINWKKWREGGKTPDLLPKCQAYWHLFVGERNTQTPYFTNIKGKSVKLFRDAMETQLGPLLQKLESNAVMLNRTRGYKYNKNTRVFEFVGLPEGQTEQQPAMPLPNIFDIVFTAYSTKDKAGDIVWGFKDFMQMKPEVREEFGSLYAEFLQRNAERMAAQNALPAASEEAQGDAAVMEGEYVEGTVSKDAPISI
jgi:hypothetical protein